MSDRIRELLARIQALEEELQQEFQQAEAHVLYEIRNRRVHFDEKVKRAHRRLRMGLIRWLSTSHPLNVLSAPVIYAMIVPIALFDLCLSVYQALCFRLYGIRRVRRSHFIALDRHHLAYLNALEKLNCVYCGYANGVIGYAREIAARTEQYWCPIKHARRILGTHSRYPLFRSYADAADYQEHLERLRKALAAEPE
jgi:hypothetical protein